ncbi:MAG: UDP-N-acetylglucosamine 1-carboxyvinyltransferase [bacterium]|nr:UDP-N-acetylglucosamine 1-carboxyvinyltransferase [bacterium]
MPSLVINGNKRLTGKVEVDGAKNSVLPLLAATILCNGKSVLHNCPILSDVDISLKILEGLGCVCKREGHTITVDSSGVFDCCIPETLMRQMRSSIVFLGAIVSRCSIAKLSTPGGCELGPRPIDLHLSALRQMGLEIKEDFGILDCKVKDRLHSADINLSMPSVGATENIILAAVNAEGLTVIRNAAREPEIVDLANFLKKCGAKISGAGTGVIEITGVSQLKPCEHSVIPDRIAAATYLSAAAITGGDILVENVDNEHIISIINCLEQSGCRINQYNNSVRITAPERIYRIEKINTLVYPGFPTDAGPPMMAAATVADGTSMFIENIFDNRYKFVDEIKRLGAKIKVAGRVAVVEGVKYLTGAAVEATDLRGGAALVLAGLAAHGTTTVGNIWHIDRGYECIENKLCGLGAEISRIV